MNIYQNAILYLLKDGNKYPSEVGKLLGIRKETAQKHISLLLSQGVIELNRCSGKLEYWEVLTSKDFEVLPAPPVWIPKFKETKMYLLEIKRDNRKKKVIV
tara:strand:- start:1398 stop:1700 length:303 start_codon:yes stop_codon:yes gene_type:complete